ncbi:MAG: DUF1846 family protein, partial [Muribaculaceae bacterium]|nr:DUF1846 family protein [Muribaculaceae bacterium]
NMVGFCISDDKVCCEASNNEIIRRYFTALNSLAKGEDNESEVNKIALLLKQAKIGLDYRQCIKAARDRCEASGLPCSAIQLADGTIITAEQSELLGPSSALILNVVKHLAGIDHDVKLIPQEMIEPIQHTKLTYLKGHNPRLHSDEVLVALSVLSTHDEKCRRALETLPELNGCQAHSTVMLGEVDHKIFKKLGISLTCDPAKKD